MKKDEMIVAFTEEDLTASGLDKVRMIHEAKHPKQWANVSRHATILWPPVVMEAHVDATELGSPKFVTEKPKKKRWWHL